MTPHVLELLRQYIETFEDLEVALALTRAGVQGRSPAGLAAELNLPDAMVAGAVERMIRLGLIRSAGGAGDRLMIDRSDPQRAAAIDELVEQYTSDRVTVMAQMSANALERVRTAAVRAFARAFVLGGKKDG
jgi:hypothetical protein